MNRAPCPLLISYLCFVILGWLLIFKFKNPNVLKHINIHNAIYLTRVSVVPNDVIITL